MTPLRLRRLRVLGALLAALSSLIAVEASAQTTYTWNITGSGAYTLATNWTPARLTPLTDDVLVFDGDLTPAPTVTAVGPNQTIGRLRIIDGANVTFSATANRVLTLGSTGSTALQIAAASTLQLTGSSALTLTLGSGASGAVAGTLLLRDGAHRLLASDANAVVFASGSTFQTSNSFTGNAFGNTGTANAIRFQSGSNFIHAAGSSPFGLTAPSSRVVLDPGSTFQVQSASGFDASGRTYGHLTITNSSAVSSNGSGDFQFQNLTIASGASFTHTGSGASRVTITGDVTQSSSSSSSITAGSAGITVSGSGTRIVSGAGAGTLTFGSPVTIAAGTTFQLSRALTGTGTWTVNGAYRHGTGGALSTATLSYGAAGILEFANTSGGFAVTASSPLWPASGGPNRVRVLGSAGITLNSGAARTVPETLYVGGPITNTGTLTVNGTLVRATGGSLSAAPTYGASAALLIASPLTIGPEWGGAAAPGLGVPLNVRIDPGSGTVNMPSGDRHVPGTLTSASGTFALNASGGNLLLLGNWSHSGSFVPNNRTVALVGMGPQTISAAAPLTLDFLQNAKATGNATLSTAMTLSKGLFLSGTNLVLGATLTLGSSASVTQSSGYVIGTVARTVAAGSPVVSYPIGTAVGAAPVTLEFHGVLSAFTLSAVANAGDHAQIATSPLRADRSVNATWTLTPTGGVFDSVTAVLGYAAALRDPAALPLSFLAARYAGAAWSERPVAVTSDTTLRCGLGATFGDLAVGDGRDYTITTLAGSNGSISPAGPVTITRHGSQLFTFVPALHYHASAVRVDGAAVGVTPSYLFSDVAANHSIEADFGIDRYVLSVVPIGSGSGTVARSPNQADYASGSIVQLTATPGAGSRFETWGVGASGSANPVNVVMDSSLTVTARFESDYHVLTVSLNGSGTVTKNPDLSTYFDSTTVQLAASPAPGWTFTGWSGDASGTSPTISVLMNGAKNITAGFVANLYPIVTSVSGGGDVLRVPDQLQYAHGTVVQVTASPQIGWEFVGWSGSLTGATNPASLTVDGAENVQATFVPTHLEYTLERFTGSFEPIAMISGATKLMVAAHDSTRSIPLPFYFVYAGLPYTPANQLAVNANGFAYLTRWPVSVSNPALANNANLFKSSDPNNTLAPWYDDLTIKEAGTNPAGFVIYQVIGTPGNRALVVQWTNVSSYLNESGGQPRQITFQLRLYEGTNAIEFQYGPAYGSTSSVFESASIGIEDSVGGNNHFIDAMTGSRLTGSGLLTSNKWPDRQVRFTPGAPTPLAGGTYTVGVGGTYPNLNEAAAALNHRGVSGPVTLNLTDADYDSTASGGSNVFPILIGPVNGSSAANPVVIQSASNATLHYRGTMNGFAVNQASATAIQNLNEPIIGLVGADYVTLRRLTLDGGAEVDRGVLLIPSSRSDGASDNTLDRVNVTLDRTNTNSIGIQQHSFLAPVSADGTNSRNQYLGVSVQDAAAGLALTGNASYFDVACEVASSGATPTVIGAATPGDIGGGSAPTYGIRAANQTDVRVAGCEVRNLLGTGAGTVDGIAVENQGALTAAHGAWEISSNRVHDLAITSTSGGRMAGIRTSVTSSPGSSAHLFNNMVSGLSSNATLTLSRKVIGIFLQEQTNGGGGRIDVDFNSVRLQPVSLSCSNACLELGTLSGPLVRIRNNVFANFTPAQAGAPRHYAMVTPGTGAVGPPGSLSDRNVLYVSNSTNGFVGLAGGADRTNLLAWQAATAADAASRSMDPRFMATTDLHVDGAQATPVEGMATFSGGGLGVVTTDVDGDLRNPTKPDAGADEGAFVAVIGSDVAATAVLGPTSPRIAEASFTPSATFANYGADAQPSVPVRFRVRGPQPSNAVVYDQAAVLPALPSGGTANATFPAGSVPAGGDFQLEALAELPGDETPSNDLKTGTLHALVTVNVTTVGNGTVTKSPDLATYEPGTSVQITGTPASGYHLVGWTGDVNSTSNPLNVVLSANLDVTGTFAINTYPLTVSTVGNGSVTRNPDLPAYNHGSTVQLTAVPSAGWTFTNWSGSATGSVNPTTVLMDGPKSVTATFTVNNYALSVATVGNGTVTKNPDQPLYAHGTVVQLTAVPGTGYSFTGWSGDATGSTNPTSVVMDAPRSVTATFTINSYTLSVSTVGTGSVTKNPNQGTYTHGTSVDLTATPGTGYTFTGWSGDTSGTANPLTVVMTRNRTITATFTINTYTLSVSTVGSGTVTKNPNQGTYNHGTSVLLTANPGTGYSFTGWGGDTSGTANPLTVVMTRNRSITATFTINSYTLAVNIVGNGTVTKSPDQPTYTHGTVVQLTASPGTGYSFTAWGGDTSGTANPLTVVMTRNRSITATFTINSYTLSVSTVGTGSVTKSPNQGTYNHGTSVLLTANPGAGFSFTSWGGDTSGTTNPMTVVMTRNRSITATFTINTYTVAVSAVGNGTVTRNPSQATYNYGTSVQITASPGTGYSFTGWSGDTSGTANPFTVILHEDKSYTGTFTLNSYTLSVSTVGSGSVTKNPNQATYTHGTSVDLTATPGANYTFTSWGGDTSGTANPLTVVMTRNRTITATFTINSYTLSVNTVGNGTVTKNPDQPTYTHGTVVQLTPNPGTGYSFTGWGGDTSGTANPMTVVMTRNRSITATFTLNSYTLSVSTVGTGSVTKNPNQGTYTHGTVVQLTATPGTGYSFTGWGGDTSGTANPLTVVMTRNRSITATFTINTYTLSVSTVGTGTVTKNPNQGTYNHGTSVLLTANPGAGFTFTSWGGDTSGTTNPMTVVMTRNRSITATFTINTYTLSVSAVGNGTVTRNPSQATYNYGSSVQVTANPGTGYSFTGWSGDTSGTANPFTVILHEDKSYTATFTLNSYTLSVSTVGSGTVTKSPNQATYTHGTSVLLTANPSTGYSFTSWGGDTSGTANPLTVVMTRNRSITATFSINTFTVSVSTVGNGTVTRNPSQATYNYGTSVQVTANPGTGYSFTGWSGDTSGTANPFTVILHENKSFTATFTINSYALSVTTVGSGTVAASPNQALYDHGTVVQLTATPATNWSFSAWSGDATGSANPLSLVMDGPKDVTATFTLNTYALTISTVGTGSVAKNPNQATYAHGTSVQLTANPGTGYSFTAWSGDATGSTNPTSVVMDGPKSVTATFTLNEYVLTVNTVGSGTVAKNPNLSTYGHGTSVQLTATAAFGWTFTSWSGDATGSTNPTSVVMDAAKTVTATFTVNHYALSVSTTGSGTVTKNPNQAQYDHGTSVTLSAFPFSGYTFKDWSGDLGGSANPTSILMEGPRFVTAHFGFALDISISGPGSVSADPEGPVYDPGTEVTLSATADPGYVFLAWGGDVVSMNSTVGLTMTSAKSVDAYFVPDVAPAIRVSLEHGGGPVTPGTPVVVDWLPPEDTQVTGVDLFLSRSGPEGPWEALLENGPASGKFEWRATAPTTDSALIRVVAHGEREPRSGAGLIGFRIVSGPPAATVLAFGLPSPNPVASQVRLPFSLPREGRVSLRILDLQGRERARIHEGTLQAGPHEMVWRGPQEHAVPPGVYFAALEFEGKRVTRRLVVTY